MGVRELESAELRRPYTWVGSSVGLQMPIEDLPQICRQISSPGSGGLVTRSHLSIVPGTGAAGIRGIRPSEPEYITDAVLDIPSQLSLIKDSFSLSITDMSKILMVERPTIYSWLNGGPPREANQTRINFLMGAAGKWNSACTYPIGKYLKTNLIGRNSVFELLCAEHPQDSELAEAIEIAAAKVKSDSERKQESSLNIKLARKGFQKQSKRAQEIAVKSMSPVYLPDEND